jgi:hypothetical protein
MVSSTPLEKLSTTLKNLLDHTFSLFEERLAELLLLRSIQTGRDLARRREFSIFNDI